MIYTTHHFKSNYCECTVFGINVHVVLLVKFIIHLQEIPTKGGNHNPYTTIYCKYKMMLPKN